MESLVRMEVFNIFFMGTLVQASVSSAAHCTVRATRQEDIKSIRDAYDNWATKTFRPCGVSVMEMEANESSLEIMAIRGGAEVPPERWPWHVLVYSTRDTVACGGTLISRRWVVTAAHCAKLFPMDRVWAGIHKRSEIDRGQKRAISRIISHERFNRADYNKDIALLKLEEPFHLSDFIWPACLPSQSETFGQGEECYITGYGATSTSGGSDVLKELAVRIMDSSRCERNFFLNHPTILDESMFCSELGGTASTWNDGTCAGDSGGPFVCRRNHQWTLVGIISAGAGCMHKLMPDIFTNVSYFRDWIDHTMLIN